MFGITNAKVERFAPSVSINGRTITPPGWVWVLGFAIGGCKWAIEEAEKPEFLQTVRGYLKNQHNETIQQCIEEKMKEIERLKRELRY